MASKLLSVTIATLYLEPTKTRGSSGICIFDLKMVSTGLSETAAAKAGIEVLSTSVKDTQKTAFIEHDNPDTLCKIVYDAHTREVLGTSG